jgi:sigma-B regulation protein RsbU (phosphoserine phosphatase)
MVDGDVPRDDDAASLYDDAPCGYLSTTPDGLIINVNRTFTEWTGHSKESLLNRRSFIELLSVGGRLYHETHYAPLLRMQGRAREVAFDIVRSDGSRMSALVNAVVESDEAGRPRVVRTVVFDATERRLYEQHLVEAKAAAERSEAKAHRMAETLQQTLIPPRLPDIEGLEVSAVYRPAGTGDEVGGDFYDLFQISTDHWILAVGDVEGKGVDAAVVTSLARYTIRAYAVEHHSPRAILHNLNAVLLADATNRLCTAVVASLRREPDAWRVTIATGGHPLPILRRRESPAIDVGRPGTVLGFYGDGRFFDDELVLGPGDMLVACTDGVSEARRGRTWFGDERIKAVVDRDRASARTVTADLLGQVLSFQADRPRDDIAIVAIRVT